MALNQSNPAPRIIDGETSLEKANAFVSIRTSGARDLAKELERVAGVFSSKALQDAVKQASKPIASEYRDRVRSPLVPGSAGATGNLAKSVRTELRSYENGQVAVAVTGPKSTGNRGATDERGSGNHSWLVEFGSGRRRPGTQGRRTYINVHQSINRKMHRSGTLNDQEFARKSRGYYFLMGSINEQTRQSGRGKGYSHDFASWPEGRDQHPITLGPGDTYGEMPAFHVMERTIDSVHGEVETSLLVALQAQINRYSS